jgi:hypothetical protein
MVIPPAYVFAYVNCISESKLVFIELLLTNNALKLASGIETICADVQKVAKKKLVNTIYLLMIKIYLL